MTALPRRELSMLLRLYSFSSTLGPRLERESELGERREPERE